MSRWKKFLATIGITLMAMLGTVAIADTASAGTIKCGNQAENFANRSSSSVYLYTANTPCGYNWILTVYGDNVWLDSAKPGAMRLDARTACDVTQVFPSGVVKGTWRNYDYSGYRLFSLSGYISVTVTLCSNF